MRVFLQFWCGNKEFHLMRQFSQKGIKYEETTVLPLVLICSLEITLRNCFLNFWIILFDYLVACTLDTKQSPRVTKYNSREGGLTGISCFTIVFGLWILRSRLVKTWLLCHLLQVFCFTLLVPVFPCPPSADLDSTTLFRATSLC